MSHLSAGWKLLLATVAGALTMFFWGAISHMVLLKGVGYTRLPNEPSVVGELRRSLPEDGLYFFPSPDFTGNATPEETAAWEGRFRAGPTGMIIYHPAGSDPVSPRKLLVQLLSTLLAGGIAGYVASLTAGPYWKRVLRVGLLGAFSALSVGTIFWNWYGFPTAFFLAQCLDMVVGWTLAGAVLAKLTASPGSPAQVNTPA